MLAILSNSLELGLLSSFMAMGVARLLVGGADPALATLAGVLWCVGWPDLLVLLVFLGMNWFLHTDLGLTLRATGNNEVMIRALGVNTDAAKVATLVISNALVGLSGSGGAKPRLCRCRHGERIARGSG